MTEEKPVTCSRCDRDVIKVHALSWMIVDMYTPGLGVKPDRSILCCKCMLELGEFMVPELKDTSAWVSGKDQLFAAFRDREDGND